MPTTQDVLSWRGQQLCDRDGDKVGKIEEIYLDPDTEQPEWALVNTGLFGSKSTFVPLRDANADGDDVRVPYAKDQIKDAPRIDADGELSRREEDELYRHYGLDDAGGGLAGRDTVGTARDDDDETAAPRGARERDEGDDALRRGDGGDTDDAMTRSEEELHVGTVSRETGRARLRKYIVTDEVQETVPVQREEPRVEREPITDDNVEQAMRGPELSEAEHEVVLRDEEPVVEKETVPKERVRLETDTVTEERQVSDSVRKERIEFDDPQGEER